MIQKNLHRLRPLLPWLSLLSGILGGLLMDRSPERAWLVITATLGGWLGLLLFLLAMRLDRTTLVGRRITALNAGLFVSRVVTQSGVQVGLFFALPFYVRASAGLPGHVAFLALLLGAAALTLWDPLYEAVIARPVAGAALQAFATFAALNVVLPVMGWSNAESLQVSAFATSIAIPITVWLSTPAPQRLRTFLGAAAVAFLVPIALNVGAIRSIVPAAPLHLLQASLGTRMEGMTLADPTTTFAAPPSRLVCATIIGAPRGLQDGLVHVWSKDDVEVDRIGLSIRGGNDGFHTWSTKQNLGDAVGTWTCAVVTESGQSLGVVRATVLPPS